MRALARELLYVTPSLAGHMLCISRAMEREPPQSKVEDVARRTLAWTGTHPQPRLQWLWRQLAGDRTFLKLVWRHGLAHVPQISAARMHPVAGAEHLPSLETVRALADWLRLDPEHLWWFADTADRNRRERAGPLHHFHTQIRSKADDAVRVLEVPKARLKAIQRQIHQELLVPVRLHPAVHGFRHGRSILTFAAPHAGKAAVLRLDLQDFFPGISGPRVQTLFRTLGYPEPVADLLGALCTTTTPRTAWAGTELVLNHDERKRLETFYARPHLPQGAPSSPAIANLCAFRLDRRLTGLARAAKATYTRYADDLAFSGDAAFARHAKSFGVHVAAIAAEEGFQVHHRKTRLMRSSVRQQLAGLVVNGRPNMRRADLERLEAILTNCVRFGPAAQNREAHPEFRRHLEGRVAFATMVGVSRAERLQALLRRIDWGTN